MTASEVGKEIQYLRALLHDVGFTQLSPTNVYEDNLACIAMSTNPVRRKSSRTSICVFIIVANFIFAVS